MVGPLVENVVDTDTLARAIISRYRRSGELAGEMGLEDAIEMAFHILNFFGFSDRIIDNVLEPEDRDIFYMMEDLGLLLTEREETTLYDGREWRIHYWLMRKDMVFREAERSDEVLERKEEEIDPAYIYEEIPEEIWFSRGGGEPPQ